MSENAMVRHAAKNAEQTAKDLEFASEQGAGLLVVEVYHPDGKHAYDVRAILTAESARGENFYEHMSPAFEAIVEKLKKLDDEESAA